MKKCPFCAEEIQDEAIKCKHCHEFLDITHPEARITPPPIPEIKPAGPTRPWFFRTDFLVAMLLSIGPLALPLLWANRFFSVKSKILITLLTLLLTYLLFLLTKYALQSLQETIRLYQEITF